MGETTWRFSQQPGIFSILADPHMHLPTRNQDPPQTLLQATKHSTLMHIVYTRQHAYLGM